MTFSSLNTLIHNLGEFGYRFTKFCLQSEGEYSPLDADWNYKDVPHLAIVHKLVDAVPVLLTEEVSSGIFIQRIGPFKFPLTVTNHGFQEKSNIYFTSFGPFVLLIETRWSELKTNYTRVITTYAIGSSRILQPLHRLIKRLITRNYYALMSDDLPMRERRGKLRSQGYSFKYDSQGYGFASTTRIGTQNVLPPASLQERNFLVSIKGLENGRHYFGSDDFLGIQISKTNEFIRVFPRICDHEGASLDEATDLRGSLICPWHGKKIKPLMELDCSNELSAVDKNLSVRVNGCKFSCSLVPQTE